MSIERYLGQIASADRQEAAVADPKARRLQEQIKIQEEEMLRLEEREVRMLAAPDEQMSLTDPDVRSMANRTARIVWAMLRHGTDYEPVYIVA